MIIGTNFSNGMNLKDNSPMLFGKEVFLVLLEEKILRLQMLRFRRTLEPKLKNGKSFTYLITRSKGKD
jgi:hypothetical protein